jgi:hypothetical protein
VLSNKTTNAHRVIVCEEINFTRDVEGKENKTQNDERGLASGLYIHEISLPLASARLTLTGEVLFRQNPLSGNATSQASETESL